MRAIDGPYKNSIQMFMSNPSSFGLSRMALVMYVALLFGNALGAYNIASIPIQWLVNVALITTVVLVALTDRLYVVPGSKVLLWLFLWSFLVTGFNILLNNYASLMPPLATTSYPIFVSLRFLSIFSFTSVIYLVYWLCIKGYRDMLIKWTVIIGAFIALIAIYVYFAQVFGLPEPLRTRMGTGGGTQSTVFTYAFHRAMGTFREPSHLAEWLVVPFFLSVIYRRRVLNIYTVLIGVVILLTGSLTAIIGSATGFAAAILLANPFRLTNLKVIARVVLLLLLSVVVFHSIVAPYVGGTKNIFQVVSQRLTPIIEGRIVQSSRGGIYEYVANTPFPLFGYGLGNANILLGEYFGQKLMGSFLNLYFFFLFSTGVLGLGLFCLFLGCPVFQGIRVIKNIGITNRFLFMFGSYLSWLAMFVVEADLSVMFGVAFALLTYEIYHQPLPRSEEPSRSS